jgi:hypothetical protein
MVHAEDGGQFTAQAVGLPLRATAASRDEALARLNEMLHAMVSSGTLVAIEVPAQESPRWDPNNPEMLAFMKILEQQSKEDLERTLQELERACFNSSSTPTT